MKLRDDFDLDQLRAELREMTDVERSQQGEAPDCFRFADHLLVIDAGELW
jgi:hypothetical protein